MRDEIPRIRVRERERNINVPAKPKKFDNRERTREVEAEVVAAQKKFFLRELGKQLGIVKLACTKTGIERHQYNEWCREDKEFLAHVKEVIEPDVTEIVESKYMKKMLDDSNMGAMQWWLSKKGKSKGFGDSVAVTGPDGGPIEVNGTFTLIKEELPLDAVFDALKAVVYEREKSPFLEHQGRLAKNAEVAKEALEKETKIMRKKLKKKGARPSK